MRATMDHRRVRVSKTATRYFELDDGTGFIPIGLNLCVPRLAKTEAEGAALYDRWIDRLGANGGNYARLFLGDPFFDVEPSKIGCFEDAPLTRLKRVLDRAAERGIRLKLTLEHFRHVVPHPQDERFTGSVSFVRSHMHPDCGGPAPTIDAVFDDEACRKAFCRKLDFFAERIGEHPGVFAWELWNEINSVGAPPERWLDWTDAMLAELKVRFPNTLAMQSLGSYDRLAKVPVYLATMNLRNLEVAHAHRYLDLGAPDPLCRGPVDVLAAEAITALRAMTCRPKPAILGEIGAVEPRHSGPWALYERDPHGSILHDGAFAPFFAGSAGAGQAWHWHFYVDRHELWHHYARFAQAVHGFDPVREDPVPHRFEADGVRIYILRGKNTTLAWCRDGASDWRSEVERGDDPAPVSSLAIPVDQLVGDGDFTYADAYDPWGDVRTPLAADDGILTPPPFKRSIVIRCLS